MRLLTKTSLLSFILLISSPTITAAPAPEKPLLQAKDIIQQVKERGVNPVVAELGEQGERDKIAYRITTGDPEWINVAFKLLPSMKNDFTQQILNSLSFALINNPVKVLELAKKHNLLSSNDICTIPSTLVNTKEKQQYIRKVAASLKAAEKSAGRQDKQNIEICQQELALFYIQFL
ncbi:MAG: hypothetical protein LBI71_05800 [Enterobacteriaceae bacterium]|jgi:hypothetical protein|nr:hypothetical protein [Enterobacteriaceae bacterium]